MPPTAQQKEAHPLHLREGASQLRRMMRSCRVESLERRQVPEKDSNAAASLEGGAGPVPKAARLE